MSFALPTWQPEVVRLTDESHLVAWDADGESRDRFVQGLAFYLSLQRDTQAVVLEGRRITSLESFCEELERALPGKRPVARTILGRGGVADHLKRRHQPISSRAAKFRYYLWRDADALLRADPVLFGQLVEALAGVAAEAEYADDDLLLIQRAILVGTPALDIYGEDSRGQFRTWLSHAGQPGRWQRRSGLDRPPFVFRRISDTLPPAA